jgi:N-acetylglucosaminyldiphosphoundecaprenol N-acetyl-beta-D-mannosaminyltransferase
MLGAPVKERVAGSDIFEALKQDPNGVAPLKAFLFGGGEGAAEKACRSINARPGGIVCVGYLYPGFGEVEAMSTSEILGTINASKADMLSVSLGAQKGQAWLLKNHDALKIPVRVHLGATINFESGDVRRAPPIFRKAGLEWFWRISQEPHLWRRYWGDGYRLLELLVRRAVPLITLLSIAKLGGRRALEVDVRRDGAQVVIRVSGDAIGRHVHRAVPAFRKAIEMRAPIVIDMSGAELIDSRFTGLLLMVRKQAGRGGVMRLVNVSARVTRMLCLNGFGDLLERGHAECL